MFPAELKPSRSRPRGGAAASASSASTATRSELMDKAREEREKREAERRLGVNVIKIQAVVRSWLVRHGLFARTASELSGKLSDLNKVENVLKLTKKDVVFRPPAAAFWKLVKLAALLCRLSSQSRRTQWSVVCSRLVSVGKWMEVALHPSHDVTAGADLSSLASVALTMFAVVRYDDGAKSKVDAVSFPLSEEKALLCRVLSSLFQPSSVLCGCVPLRSLFTVIRATVVALLCQSPPVTSGIPTKGFLTHDPLPSRVKLAAALLHICTRHVSAAPADVALLFVHAVLTLPGFGYCCMKFTRMTFPDGGDSSYHPVVLLPGVWDAIVTTFDRWKSASHLPIANALTMSHSVAFEDSYWTAVSWFSGNLLSLCPPVSYLTTEGVTATTRLLGDCMEALPLEVFVQLIPILHHRVGAAYTVHEMPRILVAQLSEVSMDTWTRKLFRQCFDMRSDALRNKRLKLPDGDGDPIALDVSAVGKRGDDTEKRGMLAKLWQSSKLALKLFGGGSTPGTVAASKGLMNVSSLSRSLAATGGHVAASKPPVASCSVPSSPAGIAAKPPKSTTTPFDTPAAQAYCRFISCILLQSHKARHVIAASAYTHTHADRLPLISKSQIIDTIAFTPSLDAVKKCWYFVAETADLEDFVRREAFPSRCQTTGTFAILATLCSIFEHSLRVVDEFEFYNDQKPLVRRETKEMILLLKSVIARSCGQKLSMLFGDSHLSAASDGTPTEFWAVFQEISVKLLTALHGKHTARPLTDDATWIVSGASAVLQDKLLEVLPFTVPFATRAAQFTATRTAIRQSEQTAQASYRVVVQRARLFESAYESLTRLPAAAWAKKLSIVFVNDMGMEEIGIDAGGLFKELWTSLSAVAFNPEYGFFKTTSQGQLYPNPNASVAMDGLNEDALFEFLGKVLGKALAEGVVVQPQFARFFLAKLLHKPTHLHDHLPYLDMELYKNLMFLKNYDGDVDDLCLTFSVSTDVFGSTQEVDLIPGGSNVAVTKRNRLKYIYLVGALHLDTSIKRQCAAFRRGLNLLIPKEQLMVFTEPELQILISGSSQGISVEDLKANTSYGGGYTGWSPTIKRFWSVVEGFSDRDVAALLKFVTSCERAPPLGFKDLTPSFCIQRAGGDDDRLPTASTCFNILKLPAYSSEKILRKQLLAAIHSGAGFDLS